MNSVHSSLPIFYNTLQFICYKSDAKQKKWQDFGHKRIPKFANLNDGLKPGFSTLRLI